MCLKSHNIGNLKYPIILPSANSHSRRNKSEQMFSSSFSCLSDINRFGNSDISKEHWKKKFLAREGLEEVHDRRGGPGHWLAVLSVLGVPPFCLHLYFPATFFLFQLSHTNVWGPTHFSAGFYHPLLNIFDKRKRDKDLNHPDDFSRVSVLYTQYLAINV